MINTSAITLLDCTFRDGGYYTDWHFKPDAVQSYLHAMTDAGVDIVEIGFRFRSSEGQKGPFAYATDAFLEKIDLPENLSISVMVNAGDFISPDYSVAEDTRQLFPVDAAASVVEWVRFAFHFDEVATVKPAITELVSRGYKVGANLCRSVKLMTLPLPLLFVSWLKQGCQCSILPTVWARSNRMMFQG